MKKMDFSNKDALKKIFILLAATGFAAAALSIYFHQQKKISYAEINNGQTGDEHQTMFDYAGRVQTT